MAVWENGMPKMHREQAEEWYTNPVIVLYPASWE